MTTKEFETCEGGTSAPSAWRERGRGNNNLHTGQIADGCFALIPHLTQQRSYTSCAPPILSTLRSFTARSAGAPSRFRKQSWSPQGASRLGRAQTRRLAEHTKDRGAVDRTNYTTSHAAVRDLSRCTTSSACRLRPSIMTRWPPGRAAGWPSVEQPGASSAPATDPPSAGRLK